MMPERSAFGVLKNPLLLYLYTGAPVGQPYRKPLLERLRAGFPQAPAADLDRNSDRWYLDRILAWLQDVDAVLLFLQAGRDTASAWELPPDRAAGSEVYETTNPSAEVRSAVSPDPDAPLRTFVEGLRYRCRNTPVYVGYVEPEGRRLWPGDQIPERLLELGAGFKPLPPEWMMQLPKNSGSTGSSRT